MDKTPKEVARRAKGKTATSISLSEQTLDKARQAAGKDGRSLSNWLEKLIEKSIKLLLFFAFCASLFRWAECGDPAKGAMLGIADAACLAGKTLWFLGSCGVEVLAMMAKG